MTRSLLRPTDNRWCLVNVIENHLGIVIEHDYLRGRRRRPPQRAWCWQLPPANGYKARTMCTMHGPYTTIEDIIRHWQGSFTLDPQALRLHEALLKRYPALYPAALPRAD